MEGNRNSNEEFRFSREGLLNTVLGLDRWRADFNGDKAGFGTDPYKPEEKHHYPEAYCTFGQGYLSLYEETGNEAYLHIAESCADWLIRNPSPRYRNPSWGLPWRWATWDAPSDLSYMITTAFVGNFLVRLFEKTGKVPYLKTCLALATWMIEENGYREMPQGILFFYANHPPLKFPILNPSVVGSSFLIKLSVLARVEKYADLSRRSLAYAMSRQQEDGSWHYSEERRLPDNFHTALIVEALADHLRLFPDLDTVRNSLEKGIRFYRENLFTREGAGMDALPPLKKRWKPGGLFKGCIKGKANAAPARLWCYGAALRALSKQIEDEDSQRSCIAILQYVTRHLRLETGAFKYREDDENTFIRHEAHIFDGLATMLTRWK